MRIAVPLPSVELVSNRVKEYTVTDRSSDRLFAVSGVASVILMYAGVIIGALGGREFATITSSPQHIAHVLAKPAGTAVWVGAYVELLSFGCFLAFAVWACSRLGGGILGHVAGSAATSFVTLSVASLGVLDAIAYRSGKGMGVQLGAALVTVNEGLFVCTWFLASFFLIAIGSLALVSGRRAIGSSALAVAAIQLVTTATSLDNLGQFSFTLFMLWIAYASISLARTPHARPLTEGAVQTA